MSHSKELEREALNLPPRERERLVLAMWQSLQEAPTIDPEGIEVALRRDAEMDEGSVQPISHSEFRRRTNGEG